MNPLFEAARGFQLFFEARKWPFCFIGGLAVLRWGEPRMTADVDISLYVGYGSEQVYIDALLDAFFSRISDAREFALTHRVLLLSAKNRIAVDVVLAGMDYERQMIESSSMYAFSPGCLLKTCSAEDLIVLKAFADRPIDWMDVEGIIARQEKKIDAGYILEKLAPLAGAKDNPEIMTRAKRLLNEIT